MKTAPNRDNEVASLNALKALEVLDTEPEVEFDALVKAASFACGAPISLISLIDADRQWFKANVGLPGVTQTSRADAFCAHAVLSDELMEVPDATQDGRFADNPLVTGQPEIRFYAGAPVSLSNGVRVGTLCVIDRQPRQLNDTQREILRQLAAAAARALEGRLAIRRVNNAMARLATSEKTLNLVVNSVPSMLAYWDRDLRCRFGNRAYEQWFGIQSEALVGMHIRDLLGPDLFALTKPYLDAVLKGEQQTFEPIIPGPDGIKRNGLAHYVPEVVDGSVVGFLAQVTDVTRLKETEATLRSEITQREQINELLRATTSTLKEAQRQGRIGSWTLQVSPEVITWSEEMYRMLGCDPESPPPGFAEHANLFVPDSWGRMQVAAERAIQLGEPYVIELELLSSGARRGWIEARGEAVRDPHGHITGLQGTALDITEKRQLLNALANEHEILRVTMMSIGDAVITTDTARNITWLNPVAERMTGWLAAEAKGQPLEKVFHIVNDETRELAPNPGIACMADDKTVGLARNSILISRDGREFGIEDSASPIRTKSGDVLGIVLVFHDVSEQRRMSSEMTYRATHDAVTGLLNRAEFETRLRRILQKAREDQSEHAMLYIDLDQFKLVNDACGHAIGDQLLQQIGRLLGDAIRTRDTLSRLGGDEFAIILENCTTSQAQQISQKICDRMDDFRFIHQDKRFRIGTSIGLIPLDNRWSSIEAAQHAADASCYAAKEAGRNRVHVWFDTDIAMHARHVEMRWPPRIENALDEDGFVLFAQRFEALHGAKRQIHAEVLLRMKNEDGSLVQPGAFLPAAERFHLASRIDRWVLKHALAWMKSLPAIESIDCLSVNLSGQSVGDRAFHDWVCDLLAEVGPLVCTRLCLEITETAAVTKMADAALFVEKVRAVGVKVALDDFGAGASSFGYLKNLPVDFLKIDGQFIRNLESDPLDETAVRCFTEVAKVLGLKTVAEFVDKPVVLERLREIGVDFAQGFLIHRPAPIDQLIKVTAPAT